MQLTSGTVCYVHTQTSAPASQLSLPTTGDPPARCNRGQVQSTSPIHVTNSNPESNLSIAELIDCAETRVRIAQSGRVRLCRPCVPVTQSQRLSCAFRHDKNMRETHRRSTYLVIV